MRSRHTSRNNGHSTRVNYNARLGLLFERTRAGRLAADQFECLNEDASLLLGVRLGRGGFIEEAHGGNVPGNGPGCLRQPGESAPFA